MKKLTRTGAVVLIIAATFLVYWPALRNGFVWDDTALVLRDPLIRSWRLAAEGFRHFLFLDATASNFYRPIQRLSFVFDYQLYGFGRAWGWHLTSILIHASAAVALFFTAEPLLALFCARLTAQARLALALAVSLVWTIHPLQTSAVTYVAGRADPLAALFGFTGLALGLHSLVRRQALAPTPARPPRSWPWHLGAALCFFLAMLSKESGIIFLPLWLLILTWPRESRRLLLPWLPILAVILTTYSALRFTAEKVSPPESPPTPAAIRPILAARAFAGYAGLLAAPITLRMERDISTHPLDTPEATLRQARTLEYQTLAGILLVVALVVWFRYAVLREQLAALSLAAFVIAYLPISNLFSLNATIAEHWLYVPSAWLLLAIAVTTEGVWERRKNTESRIIPISLTALGTFWILCLGARTWLRQGDWHDQRTFIERTIAAGGRSARMLMNLGNVELAEGHRVTALARYREALKGAPDQPIIWLGYASVLLRAQDFSGAKEALAHAESSTLLAADCLSLRGALENAESGANAGPLFHQAFALAPANWGLCKRYIEYLHRSQQIPEALRTLHDFLRLHPFRAESWRMLATMLEEEHQPDLARQAWGEAAMRDVRDEESRQAIQRLDQGSSSPR